MKKRTLRQLFKEKNEVIEQYHLFLRDGRDPIKIAFWRGALAGLLFAIYPGEGPITFPRELSLLKEKFLLCPIKGGGE